MVMCMRNVYCVQELLRFLFREAKIHNAVLFFDECEMLFESRDTRSSTTLGLMLTEVLYVVVLVYVCPPCLGCMYM